LPPLQKLIYWKKELMITEPLAIPKLVEAASGTLIFRFKLFSVTKYTFIIAKK